jgi:hypothetical protein
MNKATNQTEQQPADESHVFLAVIGFGNDPSIVTSLVGLPPTTAWCVGDPIPGHPKAKRTISRWAFQSPLPLHDHVDHHLEALLQLLESSSSRIRDCASRYSTQVSCAIYYKDFTPGINLSAATLQRIAALGVSLDFDLYFLSDDIDPNQSGNA